MSTVSAGLPYFICGLFFVHNLLNTCWCESHPDVEIVSSAPSQPVVPIVELSSDDKMDKPHESDDDDEEESPPFVQMETKPLKLPSRGRHQGREGPLVAGGGEASKTDCKKSRSGSEGEGDDRRRCHQSGGSGGNEEKASGDRQEVGVLGTVDGGVDGQDESVGHQFQGISFCRTCNRHSPVDFSTLYRCALAHCPTR